MINNNSIDLNSYKPKCTKDKKLFLKLINGYQEYKEELHLIDFDDMLQKAYGDMGVADIGKQDVILLLVQLRRRSSRTIK